MLAPGMPLNREVRETFIDETVALISEAVARDCQRWNKRANQAERVAAIKTFMQARAEWMTANLGSYSACSNVSVPQLTITKINYHPQTSTEFPDSDAMEFLEIRNNGTTQADLSGVYFTGTGLIYSFPAGTTLAPGLCVILAANATIFQSRYGFSPFGQFTRQLSNSTESLILADAFGNIIDSVVYSDQSPWPDTDGNGYYLRLKDLALDNSLPESWEASGEIITSVQAPVEGISLTVYPNPVSDVLYITSETDISSISIYDIRGGLLLSQHHGSTDYMADVSWLSPGTYILRIFTAHGSRAVIFVKV